MSKNVIIVGGGLAGLAASIYLARAGKSVTIFEKKRQLGGRAITHLRHGYRFNLGPHAVYRGGGAMAVYRELGIALRGGNPKARGFALYGGERYRLPAGPFSLLFSGLLGAKGKLEAAAVLFRLRRINPKPYAAMTAREWLDREIRDARLRELLAAYIRLATYTDAPEQLSAEAALAQLRLVFRGVMYVDEGWQKIVDALHSHAVTAGVNFVTSSRVVRVDHDDRVRGVELGGLELEDRNDTMSVAVPDIPPEGVHGTRLPADVVLLAVDPESVEELVGEELRNQATPVVAACLDVAVSKLPVKDTTFALGIDQPLYFSVHSSWAQLTPRGGALIHAMKYRGDGSAPAGERELELLLDQLQPGWRDVVVHRRYLPSMIVSNALHELRTPRPAPETPIRGLYVAGDWVGEQGMLSDAALSSARAAAQAIIAQ
ncbi:MAG TPA: FAD-dependent oxidoreductase [Thermoanaerobaculia bacterium]|nr:FAD-dependent oxidoreductase [Thermoanaerobaculia bacterium]